MELGSRVRTPNPRWHYRPVDRSMEPPTLDGSNLDLPWAIVEAPLGSEAPSPLGAFTRQPDPDPRPTLRLGDTGKPPPSLFPSTPTFPTHHPQLY